MLNMLMGLTAFILLFRMKRQEQESKETISVIGPHVEIYR